MRPGRLRLAGQPRRLYLRAVRERPFRAIVMMIIMTVAMIIIITVVIMITITVW